MALVMADRSGICAHDGSGAAARCPTPAGADSVAAGLVVGRCGVGALVGEALADESFE